MEVRNNKSYNEYALRLVWGKAKTVPGYDEAEYRQDVAGAWMQWSKYGDCSSELGLGWEIDHICPRARGGTDDIANLHPLQWANNRAKGDDYPTWHSEISSSGKKNISSSKWWIEY